MSPHPSGGGCPCRRDGVGVSTAGRSGPHLPHTASAEQIRRIVKQDPNARASLALLGDKRFLFSHSGHAFIMYRVMR